MWILFCTKYLLDKQETYFIGIFTSLELAEQNKNNLTNQNSTITHKYFIKEVECNHIYAYNWSNSEENSYKNHINNLNKITEKNSSPNFYDLSWSSILLN